MQKTSKLYQELLQTDYKVETRLTIGEPGVLITKQGDSITFGSKAYTKTASGSTIVLTETEDRPLKGLTLYGKTTQNGIPAPEAPAALESVGDDGSVAVTVCGKNLFSATWEQGAIDGSTGENKYESSTVRCGYISVSPLTTYALSRSVGTSYITVRGYDADKSYIGAADAVITLVAGNSVNNPMNGNSTSCTIKTRNNVHYLRFTDNTNDLSTKYQMELGSNVTEYEPYKGGSITISTPNGLPGIPVTSGGNYTDGNGQQWICDEVDFEKGVYVQRISEMVFDGNTTLDPYISTNWKTCAVVYKRTTGGNAYKPGGNVLCDSLETIMGQNNLFSKEGIAGNAMATGYTYIGLSFERLGIAQTTDATSGVNAIKTYLSRHPMTAIYELATPIETALSAEQLAAFAALHTNYPNTTVFNEEGAYMEIEYTMNGDGPSRILTGVSGADSGYDETVLISMETDARVFSEDTPNVGASISSQIDIEMIKPFAELPKQARLVPYVRLSDGLRHSEWIQKGVYYIDTRSKVEDGSSIEKIVLHGYDDMLKAEQDYPESTLSWPARDLDVVREIAEFIGVAVDDRTLAIMNRGYAIQYPTGYSCRDVLGYIAAMYAGSFIMSDLGDLRLVTIYGIPKETRYLIEPNGYVITFGGDRILV